MNKQMSSLYQSVSSNRKDYLLVNAGNSHKAGLTKIIMADKCKTIFAKKRYLLMHIILSVFSIIQ
jgi:hypothetical protein